MEEQNLSDFLEIRSYLTGELGTEELNTILTEARASAATAAAKHLKRKIKEQQQAQEESEGQNTDPFLASIPSINPSGSDDSLSSELATQWHNLFFFFFGMKLGQINSRLLFIRQSTHKGRYHGSEIPHLLWST